jgi:hypothetical protein
VFGNAPLASTYHTISGILLRKKMRFLPEAVPQGERMNSSLTGDAKGSEQLLISSWFLMRTLLVKKLTTS